MSGDREEPDVGSVAEEAVKLLGALSGWAKDATHDVDAHIATGAAECTYCPICRTVHAVRELSPEVRTQLATAATALLEAAAGLMASAGGRAERAGGVEHIGLDDDADWPEEDR
ncbi:hypothetical protein GCM10027062_06910 [Nocardioides hungaricus]